MLFITRRSNYLVRKFIKLVRFSGKKGFGMFESVTHIIFDMDGLLLDTESTYEDVIDTIAKRYGKRYTNDVKLKIRGTPEPMTAKLAVTEMGLPLSPEEFTQIYKPMCEERLQNPPLMPGVRELVLHFKRHNIPMAIATSGAEGISITKAKNHPDIFSCIHHTVYGSSDPMVKNGKPHPDIYLICASRFSDAPSPDKCLVFEDAPNGVTAGRKAGMQVVMVPAGDVTEELRKSATLVLNTLEEFKPEVFGLPPFGK